MGVPNVFGSATTSIPLSQLDQNFNTTATLGNAAIGLGNVTTTVGNLTLTNVTITSGSINASTNTVYSTANAVVYTNASKSATTGSALNFDGTNVGVGVTPSAWSTGYAVEVGGNGSAIWGLASGTNNFTAGYYYNSADKFAITGNYALYSALIPSDGSFRWYSSTATGTAGTNATITAKMLLDASGNLGIGTSSPAAKLHLGAPNAINTTNTLRIDNPYYSYFDIVNTTGNLAFNRGTSEYMRIDSNGNLLVGTTSAAGILTVSGNYTYFTTTSTSNASLTLRKGSAGADAVDYLQCRDSGNNAKFIALSNGGLGNFSANNVNYSDERLKTDINLAGDYLSKICAIPVKTFKYKKQIDNALTLGVVAQDVLNIAPELISTNGEMGTAEDGTPYLTIYQTDLQYALMKCIQEQQTLINNLTTRLNALEGK